MQLTMYLKQSTKDLDKNFVNLTTKSVNFEGRDSVIITTAHAEKKLGSFLTVDENSSDSLKEFTYEIPAELIFQLRIVGPQESSIVVEAEELRTMPLVRSMRILQRTLGFPSRVNGKIVEVATAVKKDTLGDLIKTLTTREQWLEYEGVKQGTIEVVQQIYNKLGHTL